MNRLRSSCSRLARALLLGLALAPAAHAGISHQYRVTVDTSGVSGSSGYIDLQFNPADPGSTPAATATISAFQGYAAGSLGTPQVDGAVTGDLASKLILNNTADTNASYVSATFGASLQFLLTLDGPAFSETSTNGSSFLFALYDSSQQPLNGTSDPTVVRMDLLPFGTAPGVDMVTTVGPGFPGGADATVTAVPEASTTVMLGLVTLAGLIAARHGRQAP